MKITMETDHNKLDSDNILISQLIKVNGQSCASLRDLGSLICVGDGAKESEIPTDSDLNS